MHGRNTLRVLWLCGPSCMFGMAELWKIDLSISLLLKFRTAVRLTPVACVTRPSKFCRFWWQYLFVWAWLCLPTFTNWLKCSALEIACRCSINSSLFLRCGWLEPQRPFWGWAHIVKSTFPEHVTSLWLGLWGWTMRSPVLGNLYLVFMRTNMLFLCSPMCANILRWWSMFVFLGGHETFAGQCTHEPAEYRFVTGCHIGMLDYWEASSFGASLIEFSPQLGSSCLIPEANVNFVLNHLWHFWNLFPKVQARLLSWACHQSGQRCQPKSLLKSSSSQPGVHHQYGKLPPQEALKHCGASLRAMETLMRHSVLPWQTELWKILSVHMA